MTNFFDPYLSIVSKDIIAQLLQIAELLKDKRVVHVNSAAEGGGVVEILKSIVPFFNALQVKTEWHVIKGSPLFFKCTKLFHNAMQGLKIHNFNTDLLKEYEEVNERNAHELGEKLESADFVFIHDPQCLPLINHFPHRKGKWFWRCHIDASHPDKFIWRYLRSFVEKYDASIFSMVDFAQELSHPIYLIFPSIDPLSEKNIELSIEEINLKCQEFGIDLKRPKILQVSRFDNFKDPLGVIKSYRLAKKFKPDIQLILAGGEATDDPEGPFVLEEVKKEAAKDPDIHVLLLPSAAHRVINALQRVSDIIMQKSIKEGFGLTVTEALWKQKPVIGGNTGGIRLQVFNHYTGFLVNTPEGAADKLRYLLQNRSNIKQMGENGKIFVKENFLITRHVREYLTLMASTFFKDEMVLFKWL